MNEVTFTLDGAQILQLVITVLLPVLVGLVTTRVTSPRVKAFLLAALSVVSSLLTEIMTAVETGTGYDLGRGLITALGTFIAAVGLHYGLYKPVGVSQAAQSAFGGAGSAGSARIEDVDTSLENDTQTENRDGRAEH